MKAKQKENWRSKEPTKKQSYALYCSSGLDVRPILSELTRGELSDLIEKSNNGGIESEKRKDLINKGAVERREKSGTNKGKDGKKSYKEIVEIIEKAVNEGKRVAKEKMEELEEQDPKWAVVEQEPKVNKDGSLGYKDGKTVGTMKDLCGFASIKGIRGNSRFINAVKKLGKENKNMDNYYNIKGASVSKAYPKGYSLTISLQTQAISVKKKAHKKALEVLEKHDLNGLEKARVRSRLD